MCIDAPKFWNDDDCVERIAREIGRRTSEETRKFKTNYESSCYANGSAETVHLMLGNSCEATPDGRKAKEPFHDGTISPMRGTDKKGPTAVLKSVSKVDYIMSCNYLLNQTFMPQFLKGHEAEAFANYLKTFCDLGIHHIQFSIIDRKTLLDTQKHPEKDPDLLVRVGGYSAYFVDLNKEVQDAISLGLF